MLDVESAVRGYFSRIAEGTASSAEYEILPQMLDKVMPLVVKPEEPKKQITDRRHLGDGNFPMEGLVSAESVCAFIGRYGLKRKTATLMKMVREGRFPKPVSLHSKPYMWTAQTIREWIDSLRIQGG